jgi:hypothetical protein
MNSNFPSNVMAFRAPKKIEATALVEDTLAVAEWAIRGTAEKLRDLSGSELDVLWRRVAADYNTAADHDPVSEAFMGLIEYELDCRLENDPEGAA